MRKWCRLRWIALKDKYPLKESLVLVWDQEEGICLASWYRDITNGDRIWFNHSETNTQELQSITHWMCTPPDPE